MTTPTPLPRRVRTSLDARLLFRHLLDRGLSFHWEDDPREWVDTTTGLPALSAFEATLVDRLFTQVAALQDASVYEDAVTMLKHLLLTGRVPAEGPHGALVLERPVSW